MILPPRNAREREEIKKLKIPHKWHDYQDHCHNCGKEDAAIPCVPYELASFTDALIARVRTETLEELQGWIGERKTAHGRAHGSIDCTQCAYDDIAAHLRALREGDK